MPEVHYRRERAAVLRRFLGQDPIYLTRWFYERYEESARRNLRAALARLDNEQGA